MLIPVTKSIFSWSSNDPEIGIEQVGHLVIKNGRAILIDPPAVPKLQEAVRTLGEPEAVIITNYSHLRGGNRLATSLNVPLFLPKPTGPFTERAELSRKYHRIGKFTEYDDGTKLPGEMKALRASVVLSDGRPFMEEYVLQYDNFLITGDSAHGEDGKLVIFPESFPIPNAMDIGKMTRKQLSEILKKINVSSLVAGHGYPVTGNLLDMVQ